MRATADSAPDPRSIFRTVGRYVIYGEIAQGGMATVHLGRLRGAAGFARLVAIKRLHSHFAKDPEFVAMFTDEARLAARIRHPNVVPTLDVVMQDGELFLVMEYVHGETLARLIVHSRRAHRRVPPPIVCAIMSGALHGLHAAHEALSAQGEPLGIVHRDVSPQNILVGTDGIARVLDFGIAKAAGRIQKTEAGVVKGKLGYMSPEQLYGERVDRRTDTYAAGVVLWEALVCDRLFVGDDDQPALAKMLSTEVPPPSRRVPGIPPALDAAVVRAVDRDRGRRFGSALDMALAMERALPPSTASEVGAWVLSCAGDALAPRARFIAALEKLAEESDAVAPLTPELMAMLPLAPVSRPSNPSEIHISPIDPATLVLPPPASTDSITAASSISTTQVSVAEARPKRKVLPIALAAGAVAVAASLFGVRSLLHDEEASARGGAALPQGSPNPSSLIPAVAKPSDSAKVSPDASGRAASAEPTSPDLLPSEAMSATNAANATSAATTTSARRPATGTPKQGSAGAPTATTLATKPTNCDPPYTIDGNGHKRYKRECLR